ncbi:NADP-dependent alcohol dehydrogenase 6 [Leucoagaricus sp. SymC.cos]|nr:NADP-dependent alcohol dehydrogenase 6 [Leucoagaricus sp. SymC.cos]
MAVNDTTEWKGYAISDTKKWNAFEVINFDPKPPGDHDVDIKIEYCGVHTITGGWGETMLPVIPGHEITGHVVRVGPKVTEFKVGDRAGVGPIVCSCLACDKCRCGNEQHCDNAVDTYNAKYPDGTQSQGGFSTAIRAHEHFAFPIPDGVKLEEAAPMLCAGLTVYSPLVRNGAGPEKSVGIVGLGGLGHFAVQFAKAMACKDIVVFSHSPGKKEDALKLGATRFTDTSKEDFQKGITMPLDLVIVTADVSSGIPIEKLASILKVQGRLIIVGLPDNQLPTFKASTLTENAIFIGGSKIGNRQEAIDMLKLAADKGIHPWIELLPMRDAGKAVTNVKENKVRYRYVLKMDIPTSGKN